jgi:hypothetical protein
MKLLLHVFHLLVRLRHASWWQFHQSHSLLLMFSHVAWTFDRRFHSCTKRSCEGKQLCLQKGALYLAPPSPAIRWVGFSRPTCSPTVGGLLFIMRMHGVYRGIQKLHWSLVARSSRGRCAQHWRRIRGCDARIQRESGAYVSRKCYIRVWCASCNPCMMFAHLPDVTFGALGLVVILLTKSNPCYEAPFWLLTSGATRVMRASSAFYIAFVSRIWSAPHLYNMRAALAQHLRDIRAS